MLILVQFLSDFKLYLQFISSEKSLKKLPQTYFKFLIELFRTIGSSDWQENSFLQIVSKKMFEKMSWKNVRDWRNIFWGGKWCFAAAVCAFLYLKVMLCTTVSTSYLSRWLIHWEENGHKIHLKNTYNYFSLGKLNNFEELK